MDVENPNEFLEEKSSKKDKKPEAARSEGSDKPGAGRGRDAENTRSANPSVRKPGTGGAPAKAKSSRS